MPKKKISSSCLGGKPSSLRERVRATLQARAKADRIDDPFNLTFTIAEVQKLIRRGQGENAPTRRKTARVLQDLVTLGEIERVDDGLYRLRPDYAPQYAAIWKVIRAKRACTVAELVELSEAGPREVGAYLAFLEKGGFIAMIDHGLAIGKEPAKMRLRLVRDQVAAPEPVEDGLKEDLHHQDTKGKETTSHKSISSSCLCGGKEDFLNTLDEFANLAVSAATCLQAVSVKARKLISMGPLK